MEQPEGLQQELLKMNREARAWVLELVNQLAEARAALLCKQCGGSGLIHHATSDTRIQCHACKAHEIREAAKGGRDGRSEIV